MSGIVLIGFSGGFIEDTSLTFDGNQQPGADLISIASTIPIDDWLDATDGGQGLVVTNHMLGNSFGGKLVHQIHHKT